MNLQTFRYAFAAFETRKISARGRFVRGMSSDESYLIRFDDRPITKFQTGIAFESPEFFEQIEVENGATAQTIELMVSDGFVDDNRLVGQVDISGGIRLAGNRTAEYGAVSPPSGPGLAGLVRPANPARGSLLVQNVGDNPAFLGTDDSGSVLVDGIKVGVGGSITLTVVSAIYAKAWGGPTDLRWLEETL